MARTYKRDSRGRFAVGGGSSGGSSRPKAQMQQRGTNRLTRDNAGKITSVGGSGATARGGRLRTASGKQRGAVLMKAQGQGRLRGGKGMSGAAKSYGRGVDAAKVGRIMQRVQASKSYQGKSARLKGAKANAGRKTQQRAVDFLHKQGGFKKAGTSMGRTRWSAPDGLTREQAMRNIAERLPKQPRRSTVKTGNKKITTRAEKRDRAVQQRNAVERSVFLQRTARPSQPTTFKQGYDGSTGRRSRSMAGAARRQSSRRQVVRGLRGLGRYNSTRFSRGIARQGTIFGGTSTTYGRPRPRR